MSSQNIHLYLTSEHDCGYLPDRRATNLVPDPNLQMDMGLYSQLIQLGYRRSGDHTYRPHCNQCSACKPARVPVHLFKPKRSQRRCLKANQDLNIKIVNAHYDEEHFELYEKYINSRHADGDMVNPMPKDFRSFLYSHWSETRFMEVRKNEKLIAVAVTDHTYCGLSAVYCYFDPDESQRSLGTYCLLKQIEHTREQQFEYLYMGYWIEKCLKMKYKSNFQPLEVFIENAWKLKDVSN
jgi:arginine-tRNA-protein transferase